MASAGTARRSQSQAPQLDKKPSEELEVMATLGKMQRSSLQHSRSTTSESLLDTDERPQMLKGEIATATDDGNIIRFAWEKTRATTGSNVTDVKFGSTLDAFNTSATNAN